ncbi:MAG: hypothetical protein IK017_05850, partial [Paludibacteraceae bacterium]|nr:hypothetical protein [Paludibacteraceae bacterium]
LYFIKQHEGLNTTNIAAGMQKPFRTVDKHIRVLLQLELIERRGSKKTSRANCYSPVRELVRFQIKYIFARKNDI